MTLPIQSLANNPFQQNQDDVPSWRKAAIAAQQAAGQQQSQVSSVYSATPSQDVQRSYLNQDLQNLSQSSTQNVSAAQQSAATQKNYQNQYQQNLFNYNQQKAQAAFQTSSNAAYTALQQKYIDLANKIPGQQGYTDPNAPPAVSGTGTGTTPVQYTGQAAQIAQMARNSGFGEDMIPTIVAISLAESSGRADATHHNNNGSTDFGLMQINSVHSDLLNKYDWKDPQQNMDMAFQIYQGGGGGYKGLHAWSTYNSDAYSKFLQEGITAAKAPQEHFTGGVVDHNGSLPISAQTSSGLRQHIIEKAETYIGVPYLWGGTDLSKGVDCSGLVQGVYKQFGINLPRTSYDQYGAAQNATWGVRTSMNQLEAGDLVYFKHADGTVHHVAIWLGNNQILEAQMKGTTVHIRNLGPNDVPYGVHLYNLDPSQPAPAQSGNTTGAHKAA